MTRGRTPGAGAAGSEPGPENADPPAMGAAEDAPAARRFRPPSRRTFLAMLGATAATLAVRDRLTGQRVLRNPATGRPIWIGHV